jgi:hypothetical protein
MILYDKIKSIYPSLTDIDFHPIRGTILLQNDSDGNGDYIKLWNHPTLTRPTEAQLEAAE